VGGDADPRPRPLSSVRLRAAAATQALRRRGGSRAPRGRRQGLVLTAEQRGVRRARTAAIRHHPTLGGRSDGAPQPVDLAAHHVHLLGPAGRPGSSRTLTRTACRLSAAANCIVSSASRRSARVRTLRWVRCGTPTSGAPVAASSGSPSREAAAALRGRHSPTTDPHRTAGGGAGGVGGGGGGGEAVARRTGPRTG